MATEVVGTQRPTIVKTFSVSGQTGSITKTALYTPAATGVFRITYAMYTSVAGSGGTVSVKAYFKPVDTETNVASGNQNLNTTAAAQQYNFTFHHVGGNAISFDSTVAGASGSPQYGIDITIEQLQ
jgi:hypothetical protein